MDKRTHDLTELRLYTETVENKLNTILQCLNLDQNFILQTPNLVTCKYDSNHLVPDSKKESHEQMCFLKYNDYCPNDIFLSDIPPGAPENIVCKLGKDCIRDILNKAAQNDPLFHRGLDNEGPEPLTLDRLQCTYTSDERRAIHDAVVKTAPTIHDLSDLALPSGSGVSKDKIKSRLEVLAELRDMKRRRTKYRVAANTSKYSHVLRELIKTQMEYYTTSVEVKSVDTSGISKDNEKYIQEDRRINKKPFQKEEHTYNKSSYNSNREKHYEEPRTSFRNNYSNSNKHKYKEPRHSSDRHNEDSSNYRKSYTPHTSSRSNNGSSKIHDKYHQERYSRGKNEHREKDHASHERYRGDESSRNGEPSRHRRHRKHSK